MQRKYQNHVVDPTFFYDAIEQFNFTFDWFIETTSGLDEYGRKTSSFTHEEIQGSLQSKGTRLNQSKEGNTQEKIYEFYCKSLYRINIGDFILYKDTWLFVEHVQDYDEYGVREATLKMVQLNQYKDLYEYYKYLTGEKLV